MRPSSSTAPTRQRPTTWRPRTRCVWHRLLCGSFGCFFALHKSRSACVHTVYREHGRLASVRVLCVIAASYDGIAVRRNVILWPSSNGPVSYGLAHALHPPLRPGAGARAHGARVHRPDPPHDAVRGVPRPNHRQAPTGNGWCNDLSLLYTLSLSLPCSFLKTKRLSHSHVESMGMIF